GLRGIGDDWGYYSVSISDCFARVDMEADLSSKSYLTGCGLIGSYEPRGTITNCYSGGNSYRGLSSRSSSMTVKGSYYDKELVVVENGTGTAKTTAEMKTKATYEGWDFDTVWGISSTINDGYPFLRQFYPDFKEDAVLTTAPVAVADLVYTGEPLVLITAGVAEGGEVLYALSADGEFSAELPTATYPGDYAVYYKVVGDDNHNSLPIAGPIIATINKAAGVISFAESSMSKTYGDADFTNTLTNTGDGTVTYTSNNENIATVNSETGLVTIMGAPGDATITATVTDGTNYAYATTTATFTIGVNTAAITVSAEGFTGTYDGASHTITVTVSEPEGTTVKYGTTADEYALDAAPTYTDAGEYTIYYQVTKANYTTVENSAVVSILKAAASISYETTAVSKTFGDEAFINALTMTGDGTVTYSSDNMNVAIVNSETGEVTIKGAGTATIKATVVDGTNYTYATKTAQYTMTVETAAPQYYTLTYVVDGVVYQTFSIKEGKEITPLDSLTKEGYTFSGWSEIPATMPASDVTITGTFTINTYTLTYTVDGVVYNTAAVTYGAEITPLEAPVKEGYTFSGWSEIPATMPASDVTITGTFTLVNGLTEVEADAVQVNTYTLEGAKVQTPRRNGVYVRGGHRILVK
nr:InlB B-repeat-containing protein [Bacteroidales bacterium]